MNKNILKIIICPTCKKSSWREERLSGEDSRLICKSCNNWYIIEEGIPEIVLGELNEERKKIFFKKYEKKIKSFNKIKAKEKIESLKQKQAQMKFFDGFSSEYVLETQTFWRGYYSNFFEEIMPKIPKRAKILDVGCGTGLASVPFLNEDYTVIGIDISREMVKRAKMRIPPKEKDRHLFMVADAENIPCKEDSFDVGIGMGILHHVHDTKKWQILCQNA
jgi:2-polyprenyl-3-methyl-5-hydroxy-6-metoxy-1,4-benzoquinol methylase